MVWGVETIFAYEETETQRSIAPGATQAVRGDRRTWTLARWLWAECLFCFWCLSMGVACPSGHGGGGAQPGSWP